LHCPSPTGPPLARAPPPPAASACASARASSASARASECSAQKRCRAESARRTLRRSSASASPRPTPARSKPANEAWYEHVVATSEPARLHCLDCRHTVTGAELSRYQCAGGPSAGSTARMHAANQLATSTRQATLFSFCSGWRIAGVTAYASAPTACHSHACVLLQVKMAALELQRLRESDSKFQGAEPAR